MNKKEYIKNLKNIKLVLGNGFDLHCGLYTNFSNFYCEYFEKFYYIKNTYEKYKQGELVEYQFPEKYVIALNVWDVFFVLNTIYKNPKDCREEWCDIEKLILSAFTSRKEMENEEFDPKKLSISFFSSINWEEIKSLVEKNSLGTNYLNSFIISIIRARSKLLKLDLSDFGSFLLSELKVFEKTFGRYIYSQINNTWLEFENRTEGNFYNTSYLENAISTIDELCDKDKLVAIDSFNYSYIEHSIKEIFTNINGSYMNPIFGVDTIFEPNDWRYIFTKTFRRIDNDFRTNNQNVKKEFTNAIIYGHSLNKADYNYFFSLFDELKLLDPLSPSVLVFAFSVFRKEAEAEIKSILNLKISNIIYEYALSKNLSDPSRLLDRLSIEGRIVIFEIPEIDKRFKSKSNNDVHWDEQCKKMDNFLLIEEAKRKLKSQKNS